MSVALASVRISKEVHEKLTSYLRKNRTIKSFVEEAIIEKIRKEMNGGRGGDSK